MPSLVNKAILDKTPVFDRAVSSNTIFNPYFAELNGVLRSSECCHN
jgi:hypothetical protein